jgi:hypothetical protein
MSNHQNVYSQHICCIKKMSVQIFLYSAIDIQQGSDRAFRSQIDNFNLKFWVWIFFLVTKL